MQQTSLTQLQIQIEDLECKLAFQDQTIEMLNDALTQQQLLISKMQDQMQYMVGKVKNIDSSNLADPAQETPPPHY
ncbi:MULTISPECIES: SlyX family protein [Vibrio]|uniref:Protein SlyX homolog n=1 Tax=Vibrio chanodichtyis TaxID=3027932 RepID=A0ABT5V2U1_9VIBR|nr:MULTISPECIES: SlyX family protein [Vibrio]MDE1515978.1 SlyX family protein [Vibrio chanodichtyis]QIL85268.1 SlyX protein [Vibrio sp. HDW18]